MKEKKHRLINKKNKIWRKKIVDDFVSTMKIKSKTKFKFVLKLLFKSKTNLKKIDFLSILFSTFKLFQNSFKIFKTTKLTIAVKILNQKRQK